MSIFHLQEIRNHEIFYKMDVRGVSTKYFFENSRALEHYAHVYQVNKHGITGNYCVFKSFIKI